LSVTKSLVPSASRPITGKPDAMASRTTWPNVWYQNMKLNGVEEEQAYLGETWESKHIRRSETFR